MGSSSLSENNKQQGNNGGKFVPNEQDILQRHVAFFDRNHDGIVYPWETFQGFRAIGCGILLSTASAFLINAALSQKTRQGKFPSLLFPIEVKNIHKAKHGSDSGVYDTEGRFVPLKFEEIFAKHAHTHPNSLTSDELMGMLKANRVPKDYAGWVAAYTEWKILYVLCKDKNGLLHKDTVRAVYDGTLFERIFIRIRRDHGVPAVDYLVRTHGEGKIRRRQKERCCLKKSLADCIGCCCPFGPARWLIESMPVFILCAVC